MVDGIVVTGVGDLNIINVDMNMDDIDCVFILIFYHICRNTWIIIS